MIFSPEQIKDLNAPLLSRHVKSREQGGRALSYIEGWHAIAEANRIFGFDLWDRELIELKLVTEKPRMIGRGDKQKEGFGVSYLARVRITVRAERQPGELPAPPIVREGVGAGHGIDADLGLAHESAAKEAETDAMKRALMMFGNSFGLALYDKEQHNVVDVDLARITEFREALSACPDLGTLTELEGEYTPDILELKRKRQADWRVLNAEYVAKKKQLEEEANA